MDSSAPVENTRERKVGTYTCPWCGIPGTYNVTRGKPLNCKDCVSIQSQFGGGR